MNLTDVPKVDPDSSIAAALMDMYQSMGDALAHQYGGSAAHNTVFTERQGKWKATTQSREFIKSIKRYYSNAYTDGEKQDAINLFLGYFRPQEGRPALWELDTDYYLHVAAVGDDPADSGIETTNSRPGVGLTLAPIPACKEDFSKMKLTSFDKLIERTCSAIRDVRLSSETDHRPGYGAGTSGVAPDAAEIQLKSPNWLFGQRKDGSSNADAKTAQKETENGGQEDGDVGAICDINWLSSSTDADEEDIFQKYLAMTSVDEATGWYGGSLLADQDENSEIYKHYAELCQVGPARELFDHDPELEQHYSDVLRMNAIEVVDSASVEAEMEAALNDYEQIGSDLGILPNSCKQVADDPSWLTRLILGEGKAERV
ncbi:Phosphatidylinositol-3-phosphatase SAC1 [Linum perenne]